MPEQTPHPDSVAQKRTIQVGALARVEGEGSLTLRLRDGQVEEVQLRIFEAPRYFEAFLRGRHLEEVPDITARICGICPVAYQMSSCHALERLVGIEVSGPLRDLRRLLYCGEWIESHTLHIYFLHAPDFLGYESALAMAQDRPEYAKLLRNALQLKKAGNAVISLLGGRAIHPINVRVGGFYQVPSRKELIQLGEQLKAVHEFARQTVRWAASLDFPPVEHDYEFVALRHQTEYPMNEGRLVSNRGLDIAMSAFPDHFEEYQVPYSNASQCRRKASGGQESPGAYQVGPLARWNLNWDRVPASVRQAAVETGITWPCRNPYMSIVARSLEVLYAVEEALRIIAGYELPDRSVVPYQPRAGHGAWITEAPRGILYHRYETDASGIIRQATIIPPTSQNQLQMEQDLLRIAPGLANLPEAEAALQAEKVIRNYDPCISCATHFLKLRVEGR
ncbi:MAG TPA: Ni/Fe hydrogenase subunit alpha [Gemmataceae bacterium]|nr:Ni/Fe hydrogenase subunit alpha [Gemmataceae bacterium]